MDSRERYACPLPEGNTLTSDGVLSGTPGLLSVGTYSLKFTVEDQTSPTPQSMSTTVSLTITPSVMLAF